MIRARSVPMQGGAALSARRRQPLGRGELGKGCSVSRSADGGGGLILAVSGEIDLSNVKEFSDRVHLLLNGAKGQLVLDLQNCGFIDSTAIRALVALADELRSRGQTLALSGLTGEPQRVLGLTGLLDSGLFAIDGEAKGS